MDFNYLNINIKNNIYNKINLLRGTTLFLFKKEFCINLPSLNLGKTYGLFKRIKQCTI